MSNPFFSNKGPISLAQIFNILKITNEKKTDFDLFDIKDLKESVSSVYGHNNLEESSKVKLKAPEIAENGAIVPINVSTTLDNVESIMIFVENNPQPLSSGYQLTSLSEPSIGTRLKMGKTSNVMAAVKSGDKVYTSTQEVKVTIGGCGG